MSSLNTDVNGNVGFQMKHQQENQIGIRYKDERR